MLNGAEVLAVNATLMPVDSQSSRKTILIVTRDENLGAAATRVLEQEGYDVVLATHAGHAFLAALTLTRIDVLISELTLDDMTGEALATTLRRHHPALRDLYIADRPVRESAGILVRPFTRDELLRQLSTLALAPTSQAS